MPNSLPLQREDLNGPSFNPVPALVAKLLTVWVGTSQRGCTIVMCSYNTVVLLSIAMVLPMSTATEADQGLLHKT